MDNLHIRLQFIDPVEERREKFYRQLCSITWIATILISAFVLVLVIFNMANAETINISKLADCIYLAEGGAKTSHPYGILAHYKHTTPREACINTIKHALKDFNGEGDFIAFLGSRYCPVGAKNDPRGLNRYWVKNVSKFYARAR